MFSTKASRQRLIGSLQHLGAASILLFAVIATYFSNWVNGESFVGVAIGIVTTVIWGAAIVMYFVVVFDYLYPKKRYGQVTTAVVLGALAGPVLTFVGAWHNTASYPAVMTDIFIVAGWIYTLVMLAVLIFSPPDYMTHWIDSGDDGAAVKAKRAARAARKAAKKQSNLAENGEPKVVDTQMPAGEYLQPPAPDVKKTLEDYLRGDLSDEEFTELILASNLTFSRRDANDQIVSGTWDLLRGQNLIGSISNTLFRKLSTRVKEKYPNEFV